MREGLCSKGTLRGTYPKMQLNVMSERSFADIGKELKKERYGFCDVFVERKLPIRKRNRKRF